MKFKFIVCDEVIAGAARLLMKAFHTTLTAELLRALGKSCLPKEMRRQFIRISSAGLKF